MDHKREQLTQLYRSTAPEDAQRRALRTGGVPVAVYGLGKMGLPLATVLADVTKRVIGVDIDPEVTTSIEDGDCPVTGEPGLSDALQAVVSEGWLEVTTDPRAAARDATIHVVIVPTVLDEETQPDLSALHRAVADIADGLAPGDLVLVESTVPPGTTASVVEPALREGSDLEAGAFGLAFCPERTASGTALADIRGSYPKVVGGIDAESGRAASLFYDEVTDNDVITVSDTTTAECVKVFEGLYRDVNIALANEIATLSNELGVDTREAIEVANSQPFCDIHDPGPGVGGHCIPYYPYFVIHGTDRETPLLETARRVNESMPAYTVELLERELRRRDVALADARVGILGVTYRPDVDETRNSPALPIASLLSECGVTVFAADPVCTNMDVIEAEPITIDLLPTLDLDAVVVVTGHDAFETIGWDEMAGTLVLDGRGTLDAEENPLSVVRLGSEGASTEGQ